MAGSPRHAAEAPLLGSCSWMHLLLLDILPAVGEAATGTTHFSTPPSQIKSYTLVEVRCGPAREPRQGVVEAMRTASQSLLTEPAPPPSLSPRGMQAPRLPRWAIAAGAGLALMLGQTLLACV